MDYIVEKATELGVSRIVPLVSERTVVRPDDDSSDKKVERWHKIAVEASKQCGRTDVPSVEKIARYKEVLGDIEGYDLTLVACLTKDTIPIKEALKGFKAGKILIFIGPEGDFTLEEIGMASAGNCKFVSLGKRVLKSDTAGLFALSVIGYEFVI